MSHRTEESPPPVLKAGSPRSPSEDRVSPETQDSSSVGMGPSAARLWVRAEQSPLSLMAPQPSAELRPILQSQSLTLSFLSVQNSRVWCLFCTTMKVMPGW